MIYTMILFWLSFLHISKVVFTKNIELALWILGSLLEWPLETIWVLVSTIFLGILLRLLLLFMILLTMRRSTSNGASWIEIKNECKSYFFLIDKYTLHRYLSDPGSFSHSALMSQRVPSGHIPGAFSQPNFWLPKKPSLHSPQVYEPCIHQDQQKLSSVISFKTGIIPISNCYI